MRISVAGKIALGAMALVLAAVSVTSYIAIVRQTDAMERADHSAADLLASAVVISSAADIVKGDMANLAQTVRRLRENNPRLLAVAILDPDGKVLAENPSDFANATGGAQALVRPIQAYGQKFGEIRFFLDASPREQAKEEIVSTSIGVTAVLIIISMLGALVWASYFAKPIVALAGAADRVAGGDFSTRVVIRRGDEIGRLAERFNGMVIHLEKSRAELERTLNELSTLYSVSRIINSTSNREEILKLNIETLATGFRFSEVAILLELDHAWHLAALRVGGAAVETRHASVPPLAEIGLDSAATADGPSQIDVRRLPGTWGFPMNDLPAFAVPLRSGNNTVGLLIATGEGARERDADKILGVVASQIAPPILISLMIEREQEKLTNPFSYILQRLDQALQRTSGFGLGLSLLSFTMDRAAWTGDPTSAERGFEELVRTLKLRVPDAELIVRYGLNRVLVIVPGWSRADARSALMALDLPDIDDLITGMVSSPEDGTSAHALLAAIDRP